MEVNEMKKRFIKVTDCNDMLRVNLLKAAKAKQNNNTYSEACATYAIRKSHNLPYIKYRIYSNQYSGNSVFVTTGGTL